MKSFSRLFLPSKTLAIYIAKMYVTRFVAFLISLVATLQLLDLMAVTDSLMAPEGATGAQTWKYLSLRLPQLISQFVPFCTLLATLLTLASLNQHSEVIIMKAAGLSPHKILLPLGIPCFLIFVAHLAYNETVLVKASAELEYWQDNDYAINLAPPPEYTRLARLKEGNLLIMTEAATRKSDATFLDKVSVYKRNDDGQVETLMRAEFAVYNQSQWTLYSVRTFDSANHQLETFEELPWALKVPPERFINANLNPDHQNIIQLNDIITQLEEEGSQVSGLVTTMLHKIFGPASTLLMPLLGAIAAFGVHRAGSLLMRIIIGMALGFSFFVADNFMMAMGEFGVAPPLLAAGGPFLLFLTLGFSVLFYSEE